MLIILCYSISNFADTLLEDAERIKTEQAKRIEALERDLKVANSKRVGDGGKKEPLIEAVETVQPTSVMESKQTIVCESFSDDNYDVAVSNDKLSVKGTGSIGFCFLKHPKMQKNQILKWKLRVPKFKYGGIGMVIMPELIIFYFLMIAFERYWYICQSANEGLG